MRSPRSGVSLCVLAPAILLAACASSGERGPDVATRPVARAQVPTWSPDDLEFFLHGSMSNEVVPERVLRAFVGAYPDLFPNGDLRNFGLIADEVFGWPIGVSRRQVTHLGGLSSVGINCAACHVAELAPISGGTPVRVLGATAHFDAEAFFGALTIATFRTADPEAMLPFLRAYLAAGEEGDDATAQALLTATWVRQEREVVAAIAADPTGSAGLAPSGLHEIDGVDLRLDRAALERGAPLASLVRAILRLFHNMRAALHVPDRLPASVPPASGPGRNDAFGLLSATLLGVPRPYAPVKYGIVWNLAARRWVHWDGNTQSPIGRNILASLGLGAPLVGRLGWLDFAMLERQTELSERIRAPRYPFAIDEAEAGRGRTIYRARCASCHEGPETDARLFAPAEVGTDPTRAQAFTQAQADGFNRLLREVKIVGYRPGDIAGLRGTGKYVAPTLAGAWARSPYLHNGSVRTLQELLTPPAARAVGFQRGTRRYDTTALGYADEGRYRVDTRAPGNSNAGHAYGTDLSAYDTRDLIEYLKTL